MIRISSTRKLVVIILACFLSSCISSKHLVDGQLAYNEAVRSASDKELLLNIVRIRYQDSIEFLAINSINSTVSFSVVASAGIDVGSGPNTSNAGTTAGYSSTPTISFAPRRGKEFALKLTNPVNVAVIVTLSALTRDAHEIFRLLVTRINELNNNEGQIDEEFISATRTLAKLQVNGTARIGFDDEVVTTTPPIPSDKVTTEDMLLALKDGLLIQHHAEEGTIIFQKTTKKPKLYVAAEADGREALLEDLGLNPDHDEFLIEANMRNQDSLAGNTLEINTRSLLESMAFLSQGIDVPSEHISSGEAQSKWLTPLSEPARMTDVFQVSHSEDKPENASVAVQHRGYWYYIRDDDFVSKRTFSLVAHALRFTFEASPNSAPVLTLPVAGK